MAIYIKPLDVFGVRVPLPARDDSAELTIQSARRLLAELHPSKAYCALRAASYLAFDIGGSPTWARLRLITSSGSGFSGILRIASSTCSCIDFCSIASSLVQPLSISLLHNEFIAHLDDGATLQGSSQSLIGFLANYDERDGIAFNRS